MIFTTILFSVPECLSEQLDSTTETKTGDDKSNTSIDKNVRQGKTCRFFSITLCCYSFFI